MKLTKIGLVAASTVAAGILVFGGSTLASAATATPAPSSSASPGPGSGTSPGEHGHGPKGTEVTGDEATKIGAAVTAKDAAVTVEKVLKAEDGSYRVIGTKDGAKVMFQVSADLATVTQQTARPDGGKGGKGGKGHGHPAASPN